MTTLILLSALTLPAPVADVIQPPAAIAVKAPALRAAIARPAIAALKAADAILPPFGGHWGRECGPNGCVPVWIPDAAPGQQPTAVTNQPPPATVQPQMERRPVRGFFRRLFR